MRDLGSAAVRNTPLQLDVTTMPETNTVSLRHTLPDRRHCRAARQTAFPLERRRERHARIGAPEWIQLGRPPVSNRCSPAVPSSRCLPTLTMPPAVLLTWLRAHIRCAPRWRSCKPRSANPPDRYAVIGAFHDKRLERYRIGFGPRATTKRFPWSHPWPLSAPKDENTDVTSS